MKKEILRHLFGFATAFMLFLTLLFAVLTAVLNKTVLKKITEASGFYGNTCTELVSELKKLSPASGVDESFFDSAVDLETVRKNTEKFMETAYSGQDTSRMSESAATEFGDALYGKLCDYAKSLGYVLTDSIKSELRHLSDVCADKYSARVSNSILKTVLPGIGKASKLMFVPLAVFVIMTLFCGYFAIRIKSKISTVLCASGLMLAIPPTAMWLLRVSDRINITVLSVHNLIGTAVNAILIPLALSGIILIVLSVLIYTKEKNTSD